MNYTFKNKKTRSIFDTKKINKYKHICCSNCEEYGHIIRFCTKPIKSYGIILYTISDQSIKYVMICRKHSIGYIEFIRGKYNLNFESVKKMFLLMSKEEVKYILNNDFDTIWQNVWKNTSNLTKYLKEYNKSKNKFNIIINKYRNDLLKLNIIYDEPEWEFPKGRRLYNENNIKCAIREFKEETYIDNITINNNIVPIKEEFKGTNEKDYMNIFYLSINNINNNINNNIINKEVSIISFLNYNDIIKKLRVYNKSKIIILHKILLLLTSLSEYTSNNNFISY